ncbi:hypothetical protein [Lewinella sp. W8]|uniref:hypothetical protein n=1 Tax=Lewinella sp. W8 TaxID=2528208 RepID=UPI0010675532|nr:hypothetical protein [Lewinella sp. W8]MTB50738.1 hypothetical protein [Lewinella sp. W8]
MQKKKNLKLDVERLARLQDWQLEMLTAGADENNFSKVGGNPVFPLEKAPGKGQNPLDPAPSCCKKSC